MLVDLNPGEFLECNSNQNRTRFAFAIIKAYSVIEELGLQIIANEENPSKNSDGTWNLSVLSNLQSRLKLAGVPLDKEIIWYQRGKAPSKKKAPYKGKLMSYSGGDFVRDKKIKIEDAIAQASYLRSRISSHKFGSKIFELDMYDVKSCQYLAQILILYVIGIMQHYDAEES